MKDQVHYIEIKAGRDIGRYRFLGSSSELAADRAMTSFRREFGCEGKVTTNQPVLAGEQPEMEKQDARKQRNKR